LACHKQAQNKINKGEDYTELLTLEKREEAIF